MRLLEGLHELAENSRHIVSKSFGLFESHGREYNLPRYVFLGPKGGGDTIRIGISRPSTATNRKAPWA